MKVVRHFKHVAVEPAVTGTRLQTNGLYVNDALMQLQTRERLFSKRKYTYQSVEYFICTHHTVKSLNVKER